MNTDQMLSLLSLLNRRLHDIAILMYEVKSGPAPSIFDELFNQKNTSYSLRNQTVIWYPYFQYYKQV